MKSKFTLFILAIALFACQNKREEKEQSIEGEWDAHSTFDGKPWVFRARFKPNGIVDGIGNGKLVISMNYRVSGDTIVFKGDPSCVPGSEGVYRLNFFGDSLSFAIIQDTCAIRIANTDKVRLGKVK